MARPGLMAALLRYLVLTGSLAWLGIVTAGALHLPALYGAVVGQLTGPPPAASAVLLKWMRAALRVLPSELAGERLTPQRVP